MEDKFEYHVYNTDLEKKNADIEGLVELMNAYNERNIYLKARQDYEEGHILELPRKPTTTVGEMRKKYPRAAAYLDAQKWSWSDNPKKAALGKQAMNRILDGEDPDLVIEEIALAWAAFNVAQEG